MRSTLITEESISMDVEHISSGKRERIDRTISFVDIPEASRTESTAWNSRFIAMSTSSDFSTPAISWSLFSMSAVDGETSHVLRTFPLLLMVRCSVPLA